MERFRPVGVVLTLAGLAVYVAGVVAPFTGRSISLVGVMVGLTLVAIGGGS